jgi:hypothetical protein
LLSLREVGGGWQADSKVAEDGVAAQVVIGGPTTGKIFGINLLAEANIIQLSGPIGYQLYIAQAEELKSRADPGAIQQAQEEILEGDGLSPSRVSVDGETQGL